jgi:thiamine biosynthesis lipoprotein
MIRLLTLALGVTAVLSAAAAPPDAHRFESVEPHMGTLVRVTVYTPDEETGRRAFRAAFGRIAQLDRVLSDYRPDSELSRISRSAVGRPVRISEDLFTVLEASQELAAATHGAFDVTQGPVTRVWRAARRTGRAPDPGALREAAARSGFRKLHLDGRHRTVRLEMSGMALDVGAIGKGYAASEAIEAVRSSGVRSALVAISGDLAFSEAPPGSRGWRIGLGLGLGNALAGVPAFLELTNAAVSTAGGSQQHLDVGRRRYSHIIDPSTAMGLEEDVTVTVIARHGLDADGLDTAASVLGTRRGLALIESRTGAAGVIVRRTGEGTVASVSSHFRELVARQETNGSPGESEGYRR